MSQKPSAFEFWFGMLKSQYLPTFYPDVCQRLKIISDSTYFLLFSRQWQCNTLFFAAPLGFRPYCPPQIHETFVTHLDTWMKDESIATVLWSSEENVQIMLEVYRQSCRMPIQYTESIKKSINVFKLLFWVSASNGREWLVSDTVAVSKCACTRTSAIGGISASVSSRAIWHFYH